MKDSVKEVGGGGEGEKEGGDKNHRMSKERNPFLGGFMYQIELSQLVAWQLGIGNSIPFLSFIFILVFFLGLWVFFVFFSFSSHCHFAPDAQAKPIINKAVYTTTSVAGGWAGAIVSWAGALLIWAEAVLIWVGACSNINFPTLNMPKNAKKAKCDRPTDQRTDRRTNGRTDGRTDRPTRSLIGRVARDKKNICQIWLVRAFQTSSRNGQWFESRVFSNF